MFPGPSKHHLADAAVGSAKLATGAVQTGDIANGAVGSAQISNGAIGSTQMNPAIGLWAAVGGDLFRNAGKSWIGRTPPAPRWTWLVASRLRIFQAMAQAGQMFPSVPERSAPFSWPTVPCKAATSPPAR